MTTITRTEVLLRRDRALVIGGLIGLGLISWVWILMGAGMQMSVWQMTELALFPHLGGSPMAMGDMGAAEGGMSDGMDGMMAMGWTPAYAVLMISMWWVMMIAMMLPSVAPIILLHARSLRHGQAKGRIASGFVPSAWFLAGYLVIWLAFSIGAAVLQWVLEQSESLSAMMMSSESRWLSAGVLLIAAVYQISPLKQMCLAHCRSPAEWLSRHWRTGSWGAMLMGAGHGVFCVGCCWALMLLLFVGGVMNIVWIAALTLLVLAEKQAPAGWPVSSLTAGVLLAWGGATLLV